MYPTSHRRHPIRPGLIAAAIVVSLAVNALASLGFGNMVRGGDGELLDPDGLYDTFEVLAVGASDAPRDGREHPQMVSLAPPPDDLAVRPDEAEFEDRFDRTADEDTVNPDDALSPDPTEAEPTPRSDRRAAATPQPVMADSRPPVDIPYPRGSSPPTAPSSRTDDPGTTVAALGAIEAPADDDARDGRMAPRDGMEGNEDGAPQNSGAGGGPIAPIDLSAFRPSASDAIVQGAGAGTATRRNDHLALPEGERTQLNSFRSMYWSFFDRMQNRLSQEWDPTTVLRVQDPSGLLYGQRDRLTILSVTLESDGSLRHAVVDRSCGLDFLDAEAVRAFEAAEPFSNVPEGLKDERGRATFRFGFHVSYGRSPVIRRLDR